jgi:GNAT superfamily N-acetyltransferase
LVPRRADCPEPTSVPIFDIYPNDDPGRQFVAQLAMDAAYVRDYGIYTPEEMVQYLRPGQLKPSWEQGKEDHFFVARLAFEVVGVADVCNLSDGWCLVEPMHVLPRLWGCGIGTLLWDRCVTTGRHEEAPGLRVWSLDKNARANKFYASRGCVPVTVGTLTLGAHVENVTGFEYRFASGPSA